MIKKLLAIIKKAFLWNLPIIIVLVIVFILRSIDREMYRHSLILLSRVQLPFFNIILWAATFFIISTIALIKFRKMDWNKFLGIMAIVASILISCSVILQDDLHKLYLLNVIDRFNCVHASKDLSDPNFSSISYPLTLFLPNPYQENLDFIYRVQGTYAGEMATETIAHMESANSMINLILNLRTVQDGNPNLNVAATLQSYNKTLADFEKKIISNIMESNPGIETKEEVCSLSIQK